VGLTPLHAIAASDGGRVALVLGNSGYIYEPELANPVNDAHDIGVALREAGFSVVEGVDLDKVTADRELREFIDLSEGADLAVLFYAGHGVQVDGHNYLIPTDAKLKRRADLDFELIDSDRVIASLESGAKATVVFLDACRDNPLAANLLAQGDRGGFLSRGLAPQATASSGALIAFSTAPGRVASDGAGRNSPFTTALLRNMLTPGLEIKSLMTRVRSEVAAATHDAQIPWDTESLRTDVYLVVPKTSPVAPPQPPPPSAADTTCDQLIDPQASSTAVLAKNLDAGVRACARAVAQSPDEPRFVTLLRAAEEQRAYKSAVDSPERERSDAYLLIYPNGHFVDAVRTHLASLTQTEAPMPSEAELVKSLESELHRVGCYGGAINEVWGPALIRAASAFAQKSASAVDGRSPNAPLLDAVRAAQGVVCEAPKPMAQPPVRVQPRTVEASKRVAHIATPKTPRPEAKVSRGCFTAGGLDYCD
jgi:uncharacterized caspase-like protein